MFKPILRGLGLSTGVIAGVGFMALMGAPGYYLAINIAALAVGLIAISAVWSLQNMRVTAGIVTVIILLLFLPLLIGPDVDGVQRWIRVGPVNLHTGMLLVPILAALIPRLDTRFTCAAVALAAIAISSQPDMASALALTFASGVHAATNPNRWTSIMTSVALAAFIFTLTAHDPLQPVRFVEHVFADAYKYNPLAFIFLFVCSATSVLLPWRMGHVSPIVSATMAGFFIASFFGAFPVPLIGYGAAPILGYALAIMFSSKQLQPTNISSNS